MKLNIKCVFVMFLLKIEINYNKINILIINLPQNTIIVCKI